MRLSYRFLFDVMVPAGLIFWIILESYRGLFGQASVRVAKALEIERTALATEVAAIEEHRDRLTNRADMLNPKALDPDLLDERIRAVLGYVHEDDVVMPRDQFDRAVGQSRRDIEARAKN